MPIISDSFKRKYKGKPHWEVLFSEPNGKVFKLYLRGELDEGEIHDRFWNGMFAGKIPFGSRIISMRKVY